MSKRRNAEESSRLSFSAIKRSLQVYRFIAPYKWYFIGAMFLLVLGSLIFMLLMGLPGEMANTAIGKPKFNLGLQVKDYGWVFLIILILQGVLSYARTYLFAIVSEKGMADLRSQLYNTIITQPFTFFEEKRVGELISRITADVEQLQSAFSITLAEFIRQIVILIIGVVIIFIWTPKLSIIMLLTFPGIVIVSMIFGRYIRQFSKKRQDKLAEASTVVDETFQSFFIVKSFANEWFESIRYKKSINEIVQVSLKFAKARGLFFAFIITVLTGGIFFILWRGALMVENHTMESGDLFSFIIYTGLLGGAIASIGNLYTQLSGAIGATERILDILQSVPEVDLENASKTHACAIKGDVDIKDVYFNYPSRRDVMVLKGVEMKISPGQKVALVGQSGSGKSTIAQLLMRFYSVSDGAILIDGKDIKDYNVSTLRNCIAIVPQEVILFGGTIRENIAYGKPNANEQDIIKAAEYSNCLEFIQSFPEGFETIVGERGVKLSGGQRQRIAIARAILKDPKILILDEATSSLDAESEKLVQEALEKLMEGRTSIIIAHRLATVKNVDTIYVLDKGKIVEKGHHDQLIQLEHGVYASLARLQFES
ncbi:MAG: ATP-binding cassette domain-containing protein [Lewinellaceae bacterium]|nr:ATP-binding cassette domain-containing protein [Lewinellaceae bacterium]